jgi:hypothetical protein
LLVVLLATGWASLIAEAASAVGPPRGIRQPPRSIRYEPATDKLYDQPSSIAPRYRRGREISTAYYGNRLTEFRWLGPRGRGGMVEFFADEAARKKLDVENYRYKAAARWDRY